MLFRSYLKTGRYVPTDKLLDRTFFFEHDCAITYPIMGAFTDWLISSFGQEKYMQLYRQQDIAAGMVQVYGKEPAELNQAFADYVGLFSIDPVLEQRMAELLNEASTDKSS